MRSMRPSDPSHPLVTGFTTRHPRLLFTWPLKNDACLDPTGHGAPTAVLTTQFTYQSLSCKDGDQRVSARAWHRATISRMFVLKKRNSENKHFQAAWGRERQRGDGVGLSTGAEALSRENLPVDFLPAPKGPLCQSSFKKHQKQFSTKSYPLPAQDGNSLCSFCRNWGVGI